MLLMAIIAPIANLHLGKAELLAGDVRVGLTGFVLVAILDIMVAWALYHFFKPASDSFSLLAAWFRILYGGALLVALFPLLESVSGGSDLTLEAAVQSFTRGWDIALVLFGMHLLMLGWLITKTATVPRWIGILLLLAGAGYATDSFGKMLSPDYTLEISLFTFVGEVVLLFWLLIKGGRKN